MALFCGPGCKASYREDRRIGVIYPLVLDRETGRRYGWEEASELFGFCAYCGQEVKRNAARTRKAR